MNILYLHQYFTTPDISGGTRSYTFAKKLIEKGHKVTMITSSTKLQKKYPHGNKKINYMNIDGISVISIEVNYSQKMSYIKRIISFLVFMLYSSVYLIKKRDFDIVFATSTPLTISIPAFIAKYRNKIPFIFEVRDLWPEYVEDFGIIKNRIVIRFLESFCNFLYKKADHVVAISSSMADRIKNKYNISSSKLSVIPIGSWKYLKKGLNEDKINNYIQKFNIKDKFVIGYAGTLGYSNNMDSMLRIAKAMKDYEEIVFIVAGNGKEKNRMMREIEDYYLENIKLIGTYSQSEIINIIKLFDVCYMCGIEYDKNGKKLMNAEDALPNKFFDYILVGKPILINTKGEITRLMKQYEFGLYIDDTDEKNIRDAILKLKDNKDLIESMGRNSLKLAEIFDRDKMALRLINILEEAIK